MGEVISKTSLAIIGQEPGANEVEQKKLFIGDSGRVLDECLEETGVLRDEVTLTSAILCRPPEDFDIFAARQKLEYKLQVAKLREQWEASKVEWLRRRKNSEDMGSESYPKFVPPPPAPTPQECCAPRLRRDLDESAAPVVMPLGAMALEAVANYYDVPFGAGRKTLPGESRLNSLKKQAGSPATMPDGTIVVASYHPGFGTRKGSRHYMHVIREHMKRGARISKRGHYDWQEPHYIIDPKVDTIKDVLSRFQAVRARVTVDIETDKGSSVSGRFDPFTCRIRCIGLGAKVGDSEVIICVPLRHISGAEWWSTREEKMEVLRALVAFFNDPNIQLVGHNFAFDSSVLLRFNIMRDRRQLYDDTMLMHHDIIDCDLPHDLGFVAARYFEVPSWKGAADDKYYTEVTDHDLQLYNCRDVLTTMRLDEVLTREVYKYATTEQYAMDRRLAPVARDMGELGLFVDEVKRGELSKAMNAEAWARYTRLKEITNDPNFNANASRHIQNFLFRVKKLQPEFNSKGEAFQDGEDPSTNANALLALGTKQKLDEETRDFINNLFEYRAYKKLTGTYIDHLQVQYPDWSKHGEDIPMVPSVSGRIYYKFSKSEMKAHHAETGIWSNGRWDEAVVIPERPALSRLFTTYKLHVIPSGRMSTYPAVQNWPERGKANMRDMIVAPPGHVIVGADLDQVELRLYASISGDKLLLKAFNTPGMDPHAYNAASLFAKTWGKSLEDAYHHIVTMPDQEEAKAKAMLQADPLCYKQMGYASADAMLASAHKKGEQNKKKHRNIAKTFVYLETYGGEAEKLYMYMSMARDKATGELMFPGLREEQVHEWHNEWHKHHPETKSWQRTCAQVARVEGYTASPFGCFRKRFFPGGPNKHAAVFNHVIQASAAEVANSALLKIAEQIPYGSWSPFTGPCLQVHDYIGVYVPVQRAEEAKRIVEEAMCTTVFGIAITASAKVSERWSQQ